MSDWALSTNLYTWSQIHEGFFGWPSSGPEAELIRTMSPGDFIVPKFAQAPTYGDDDAAEVTRAYLEAIGVDYTQALADYNATVANGVAAVPFLLRVTGPATDDTRPGGEPWSCVPVERVQLRFPLSTQEFLRHRAIPPNISAQFKGTVSPGRHVQQLPAGAARRILETGRKPRHDDDLRKYTLVRAGSPDDAVHKLQLGNRPATPGDRAFLVANGSLPGVHDCPEDGVLRAASKPIPRSPADLLDLIADAQIKAQKSDAFTPTHARAACQEMQNLLDGTLDYLPIDDYGRWHDRYEVLFRKVTQAEEIAARPSPIQSPALTSQQTEESDVPESTEVDEATALAGLTIDAVRQELPDGMAVPDSVLIDAVTALRAGKHLMLGGPPGTGKSTIAEALCKAVMGSSYEVTTATADWTTFDTIGGYLPTSDGIRFAPGIVLRALRSGAWLIIDELNRADIDKAFGPLFTLLSGSATAPASRQRSTLPYLDDAGRPVTLEWGERRTESEKYVLTPTWRIIGTLNVADKASLFQLSFAFLRRFAVVDIPLPPREMYEDFVKSLFEDLPNSKSLVDGCLALAFGPVKIGPAIIGDIARFIQIALAPGADGRPTVDDPLPAFVSAVRLMAVPQYEGADPGQAAKLVGMLRDVWPDAQPQCWDLLRSALLEVELQ